MRVLFLAAVGCGRVAFDPLGSADAPSALTYREAVRQDSPVAYWRLGDTDTIARDEVAALQGTYSGSCEQAIAGTLVGDNDGALHFASATTCRVDFPGQLAFPGNAPFSLELWVVLDFRDGNINPLFMNETRSGQNPVDGFAMLEGNTPGVYFERVAGSVNRTTSRYTLVLGERAHLVGVYDGNALVLYANGTQVGTPNPQTATMDSTGATAVIGAYPPGFGPPHPEATLDEIAVYDRVLPLDRIQLHHDIGVNGPR